MHAKTCRAATAPSGRRPVLWSTGSNCSGIAVVTGRRLLVRCRLTNVLRSTRSREPGSSSLGSSRGLARTRANVSWTRSSASSRDPHSAQAARYRRATWSPRPAGASTRASRVTDTAAYERPGSAGAAWSALTRRAFAIRLPLSKVQAPKYHGGRHATTERDAPPAVPGQRGLGAHARAVPRLEAPLPRRRLGVRPLAAAGARARRPRPGAARADERARRRAALRQLERHRHRRSPRGPRARRAAQRHPRPAGEDARRDGARGRRAGAARRPTAGGARAAGPP